MTRTRHRKSVPKALEQGFKRRGVPHERADLVHELLLADGPMASDEIAERTGLSQHQLTSSNGALVHLLADGRVYSVIGHYPHRMYYATEEGEEVPCACTGPVHVNTCPNWRLPI